MKKREFIKTSAILTAGGAIMPLTSCSNNADNANKAQNVAFTGYELPELPYGHEALEPYIDTQTMQIHHGKHHAGYVRKLNNALQEAGIQDADLEGMLSGLTSDSSAGLRNNGGGHYNHSLFWRIMTPGGGQEPSGVLRDAMVSAFENMANFQDQFGTAAAKRFGSGWAWLCADADKKLFVTSTPNQDNPIMANLVERSGTPILGIDVWEHAYYLKYQNKRTEYISNFMQIINWEEVAARYAAL